jgi:CelD/BcsL family acetyltransferase involved in cellulose biosynthesis
VGVVPLVTQSRCFGVIPARTLRSLSGKHSCRFDLVVSRTQRPATIAAVWEALRSDQSWDVLEALDVPKGAAFEDLTAHAVADGYLVARWPTLLSPYLSIPLNGDDPYSHCPRHYKKVRARLENSLRRLNGVGDVRFEVATTDHTEALQRFITMELSGWKGARGSAIGCAKSTTTFYHRIAQTFATAEALRIYTLWVNQTAVAMEVGLVTNGTYFSPKATYNEDFASFSPGHLLTRYIIRDLALNGIGRYDFLGPRARHKTIWAGEVLPHANYRVFRPTLLGRMRYAAVAHIAPILRRAKRRLGTDPQIIGTSKL